MVTMHCAYYDRYVTDGTACAAASPMLVDGPIWPHSSHLEHGSPIRLNYQKHYVGGDQMTVRIVVGGLGGLTLVEGLDDNRPRFSLKALRRLKTY